MKLNKKGFTLVELLAVIAILAILLILVTPNVLNLFATGRRDGFVTQVQSTMNSAVDQESIASFDNNANKSPYCHDCGLTDNLITPNSTGVNYYVAVSEQTGGVTQIAVSNNNYCYVSTSPSLNKDDIVDGLVEGKSISCTENSETHVVTCSCQ